VLVEFPGAREVVDDLVVVKPMTEEHFGGDDGGGVLIHRAGIGCP